MIPRPLPSLTPCDSLFSKHLLSKGCINKYSNSYCSGLTESPTLMKLEHSYKQTPHLPCMPCEVWCLRVRIQSQSENSSCLACLGLLALSIILDLRGLPPVFSSTLMVRITQHVSLIQFHQHNLDLETRTSLYCFVTAASSNCTTWWSQLFCP